jgi:hypothetical protein
MKTNIPKPKRSGRRATAKEPPISPIQFSGLAFAFWLFSGSMTPTLEAAEAAITTQVRADGMTDLRIVSGDGQAPTIYTVNLTKHHSPATGRSPISGSTCCSGAPRT